MGYCAAPNCQNKTTDGIRVFRFPRDKQRRAQWVQNCRRDKWQPTNNSVLCERHFEESQFELKRADGRKLLKWNSIPTIFNVPNPPKSLECSRKPPKERELSFKRIKKEETSVTQLNLTEESRPDSIGEPHNNSSDKRAMLEAENRKLKLQIKQLTKKQNAMEKNVSSFLNPDQIQCLQRVSGTNPYKWSNQTIRHALQVKCAVGNKGYEFLRSASYPLPSSRTLSRRIESCKFTQGIQYDIIQWLGIKLQTVGDDGKICVLSLDEMQLRPHIEYDKGLKRYVGFVSSEFSSSEEPEIASHALVFIVRGLTLHWKQVVAYVFTGNSTNPVKLWDFVKKLITTLYSHGLLVKCVSSDMGSSNRSMWGVVGVHSIRNHINCKTSHPCKPEESIYFVADVPHLLKNIRNCLLTQDINLPENIVSNKKLKSGTVSLKHVTSLVEHQGKGGPVLVPNLTMNIVEPSVFEKMRVPLARNLFSHNVSSAILFCISIGIISDDAVATSWFIEQVGRWYDIMSSRNKSDGLSSSNADKLKFLKEILEWFPSLLFNNKRLWKPIQTGLQLSTTSVIQLFEELTSRGSIEYLLTSRLSTDCVENFFSQVRGTGDSHPTPVKMRHVIRMISVAQYSHMPKSSSYDVDDDDYYLEFFSSQKKVEECSPENYDSQFPSDVDINIIQMSGLYYLAGWVIHKLVRVAKTITCDVCVNSICASEPSKNLPHEWVTTVNKGNLIHPTEEAFSVCHHAEVTFQKHSNYFLNKGNVEGNLLQLCLSSYTRKFNISCNHSVTEPLISMFLSVRLHILADDINKKHSRTKLYGSKSAYMRTSADSYFPKK